MKRDEAICVVKEGFEQLEEALKAGKSDKMIRYLTVMSRFHHYSMRNTMMILKQSPDATMVAGFRAWLKLGRCVKKGETGIAIFAPMPFRAKGEDGKPIAKKDSTEDDVLMVGFKVVHVFDISQTEGDDLPAPPSVSGQVGVNLARLEEAVKRADIELVFETIEDDANGYSAGGKIVIEESLGRTERFAVLAHELAHERLHHDPNRPKASKTVRETEAEAVAFIVCSAFGLDATSHSSDYIQLYDGNGDTLKDSLKSIQSTAQWIIESVNSVELECEHSLSLSDDVGRLNGTWVKDETTQPHSFCCSVCRKFYGYVDNKASKTEAA